MAKKQPVQKKSQPPTKPSSSSSSSSSYNNNKSKKKQPPPPPDSDSDSSADELTLEPGANWGEYSDSDDSDSSSESSPSKSKSRPKPKSKESKDSQSDSDSEDEPYNFTIEEPCVAFFNGLRTMSGASAMLCPWGVKIADLTIEQVSVGSVISQALDVVVETKGKKDKGKKKDVVEEVERDVLGYTTIFNLTDSNVSVFLPALLEVLTKQSTTSKADFTTFLSKKGVGCFINERLINLPLTLVHELQTSLQSDVSWAYKNATGDGGEERKLYNFKGLLCVFMIEEDQEKSFLDNKTNVPLCRRLEEEYILTEAVVARKKGKGFFDHFYVVVTKPGGEGVQKYVVCGVGYEGYVEGIRKMSLVM